MTPSSRDDSIRQRRRKHRLRTLSVMTATTAVIAAIYGLLFSNLFRVERIRAITQDDANETVERAAWDTIWRNTLAVIPKNNFLFLNRAFINARLTEQFPDIQRFEISNLVQFMQTRTLTVSGAERQAVGVVCGVGQPCHLLDDKGILFHDVAAFDEQKMAISDQTRRELKLGIDAPYASRTLMNTLRAYWNASQSVIPITTITIQSDSLQANYIRLDTLPGWYVLVNTNLDPEATMQKVATVIQTQLKNKTDKLQYIDARYTDKVFYK